ncbi:hypothetical protein KUTeg_025062 [Tegillarca granosa]|uniref:BEACH-type PH domain-containing protein n=1 Tax=Tegillarca granosa TaxID=220873 RepID=A0ABQ9E298_TEGGR|nr:hypothetical protein KUTeg_025062 [Tegillarca granosa]
MFLNLKKNLKMNEEGPVALSTVCKLIAPGVAVNGTMAITKNELYFEMDDENEENKMIDPKTKLITLIFAYYELFSTKKDIKHKNNLFLKK